MKTKAASCWVPATLKHLLATVPLIAISAAGFAQTPPTPADEANIRNACRSLIQMRDDSVSLVKELDSLAASRYSSPTLKAYGRTVGVQVNVGENGQPYYAGAINVPADPRKANADDLAKFLDDNIRAVGNRNGHDLHIDIAAGKDIHAEEIVHAMEPGETAVGVAASNSICGGRCDNLIVESGLAPFSPFKNKAYEQQVKKEWDLFRRIANGAPLDAKTLGELKSAKFLGRALDRVQNLMGPSWQANLAKLGKVAVAHGVGVGVGIILADSWYDKAKQIGYAMPVAGEVLVAKDVVDTAISIGKTGGQAAADAYLASMRAKHAILDPLNHLVDSASNDPCANENSNANATNIPPNPDDPCRNRRRRAGAAGGGTSGRRSSSSADNSTLDRPSDLPNNQPSDQPHSVASTNRNDGTSNSSDRNNQLTASSSDRSATPPTVNPPSSTPDPPRVSTPPTTPPEPDPNAIANARVVGPEACGSTPDEFWRKSFPDRSDDDRNFMWACYVYSHSPHLPDPPPTLPTDPNEGLPQPPRPTTQPGTPSAPSPPDRPAPNQPPPNNPRKPPEKAAVPDNRIGGPNDKPPDNARVDDRSRANTDSQPTPPTPDRGVSTITPANSGSGTTSDSSSSGSGNPISRFFGSLGTAAGAFWGKVVSALRGIGT